jgi:hypothetical protein
MLVASSGIKGAIRTPEALARDVPMIHAARRTLAGDCPVSPRSSGLSTTPRIARPNCARRRYNVSPPDDESTHGKGDDLRPSNKRGSHRDSRFGQELLNLADGTRRVKQSVRWIVSRMPRSQDDDRWRSPCKPSATSPKIGPKTSRHIGMATGQGTPCCMWRQ